jgi:hypothetical protein
MEYGGIPNQDTIMKMVGGDSPPTAADGKNYNTVICWLKFA